MLNKLLVYFVHTRSQLSLGYFGKTDVSIYRQTKKKTKNNTQSENYVYFVYCIYIII